MSLKIYNTLTKQKEELIPVKEGKVSLYVCGPTVYDKAHLGNAKTPVVYDVLFRLLRHIYGTENVAYASNITDVDDKILNKAAQTSKSIFDITKETLQWYLDDMKKLNVLEPTYRPKATDYISEMIILIQQILDNNHAYQKDGHVYFNVDSYKKYGSLSGKSLKDLISGVRIDVSDSKENPADFVLWKPADKEAGEQGWESPFGYGRPGWHLECSAMSSKLLGNSFDIHGGGNDLIFPHHENELAQSMCAHPNDTFAKYWMHGGMLMVNGQKMSKSLGNFYTVEQALAKHPAEALRLAFLSTHYHQPYNFTFENLDLAKSILDKFYNALLQNKDIEVKQTSPDQRIIDALSDDLNTPLALTYIHELVANLNKAQTQEEKQEAKSSLLASVNLLGLLYNNPKDWFKSGADENMIEEKIQQRAEAKKNKDYALADSIRAELLSQGIILEDTPQGTTWKKA
ncbi:MAG: cysteine--tRNA ligase [Alphaproteobacteria bacterium]